MSYTKYMNTKRNKTIYTFVTVLFSLIIMMSASMYLFNHDMVVEVFTQLGYPTYLIYTMAIAKILGLIAIWSNKSKLLTQWAYAGFFFNILLGYMAHIAANDGNSISVFIAGVLLLISHHYYSKK